MSPRPVVTATTKKGVCTWQWPHNEGAMRAVGAGWFLNWAASDETTPAPAGVEFVPMIWGPDSVTGENLERAQRSGRVLLGFNEPGLAEQSNMTVEQALDLWPRLEAAGMRLGSPALTWEVSEPRGWLDRFMTGARERSFRVDFIAMHWYGAEFGSAAVGQLHAAVRAAYDRYGLPVWLTEYALIDFSDGMSFPSENQQVAFIEASVELLERLEFVERYAWFALPAADDAGQHPTGLFRDAATPTASGEAYRRSP